MTHLDSDLCPARFCQTPMWELSLSSLRQVSEGAGTLQHFRSLAVRMSAGIAAAAATGGDGDGDEFVLSSLVFSFFVKGKFVFAVWPLIKMAAWSYARAAASAVSNVPNQILFFL